MKRCYTVILGREYGRYFIDVADALCDGGCLYCYVKSNSQKPQYHIELCTLPEHLLNDPSFIPGSSGTLLLIGAHSDLFSTPYLTRTAIDIVKSLAPIGNPIQLATKSLVEKEWAKKLYTNQAYESQLIVFVSCPTILQWRKYEPNTSSPNARFLTIKNLNEASMLNCLLIKPYLPDVTNREVNLLINACNRYSPSSVCVGSFYLNKSIYKNFYMLSNFNSDAKFDSHPLMDDCFGVIHPPEDFISKLQEGLKDVPILRSTPCVIALLQRKYCATLVWQKFPKLCVQCQDCESLYVCSKNLVK